MLISVIRALALVLGCFSVANAALVNFDSFSPTAVCLPVVSDGGLDFTSNGAFCMGVWTGNPNGNGTPGLILADFGIQPSFAAITSTGGGAFDLNSFEMAISWFESATTSSVDVTAHFQGGGTSVQTLTLIQGLQTYNLNLLNVVQVDVSSLSTAGGYWLMDNVDYNDTVIPEPSSFALVAAGILAAVLIRRQR